jgi:hypothetical protein
MIAVPVLLQARLLPEHCLRVFCEFKARILGHQVGGGSSKSGVRGLEWLGHKMSLPFKVEGDLLLDLLKAIVHQPFNKKGWVELLEDDRLPHLRRVPEEHIESVRARYYKLRRLPREKFEELCRANSFRITSQSLGE